MTTARFAFSTVISCLLISWAHADGPVSTDDVYACTAISGAAERLACFDAAVGKLQAAESAGEVTTVSRQEVEAVQKEAFGLPAPSQPTLSFAEATPKEEPATSPVSETTSEATTPKEIKVTQAGKDGRLTSITAAVSDVKVSKISGLTVTLENGQIWRQAEARTVYYSPKKGVKEATVKRARFGGYRMKLDGGTAFRVKRIK